jgi:DMSO/TMAO reductase YedYZ molybdopterin-dependent catalytic subunit
MRKSLSTLSRHTLILALSLLAIAMPLLFQELGCSSAAALKPVTGAAEQAAGPSGQSAAEQPAQTPAAQAATEPTQSGPVVPVSDPAISDGLGSRITPTNELVPTGMPPTIDMTQYRLTVEGLVDNPLSLSYGEIIKYPAVTGTIMVNCAGLFTNNAQWTGIPLKVLLTDARVQMSANKITFEALDGYLQTLSLEEAQQPGVLLAYMVNGEPLPALQGYPLRLVVKGQGGNLWVKWLTRIRVR